MSTEFDGQTHIDPILPSLEIGCMVAMILFGISTVQIYTYFSEYHDDLKKLKIFVIVIWLLEFAHSVLAGYAVYVTSFGQVQYPETTTPKQVFHPSNSYSILISVVISVSIQLWFSYRLYKLSQSAYLPILCAIITVTRFIVTYVALLYRLATGDTRRVWSRMGTSNGFLASIDDLIITMGLCWCIWRRRRTRFINKTIVDKILLWCIQTNLLTGFFTTMILVLYHFNSHKSANYAGIVLSLVVCRMYSISFFASLIARRKWVDQLHLQNDPSLSTIIEIDQHPQVIVTSERLSPV